MESSQPKAKEFNKTEDPTVLFSTTIKKIPAGQSRADKYLSILLGKLHRKKKLTLGDSSENYSRTATQKLFKDGQIFINGSEAKANFVLSIGDNIQIKIAAAKNSKTVENNVPLPKITDDTVNIILETPQYYLVNKPAGLLVHEISNPSKN
jgi:23S rRNA-/tRNA-specific pseudouridylate synthase